jgi:hypothetical protein
MKITFTTSKMAGSTMNKATTSISGASMQKVATTMTRVSTKKDLNELAKMDPSKHSAILTFINNQVLMTRMGFTNLRQEAFMTRTGTTSTSTS